MLRGHWQVLRHSPSSGQRALLFRCQHALTKQGAARRQLSGFRANLDLATAEPSSRGISKSLLQNSQNDQLEVLHCAKRPCSCLVRHLQAPV